MSSLGEILVEKNMTQQAIETLMVAWGLIANVDWTQQPPAWRESVIRWRDEQFNPLFDEIVAPAFDDFEADE